MADRDAAKPEPTMEEILSSIQKIITGDDDSDAAAKTSASETPVPASVSAPEPAPASASVAEPTPAATLAPAPVPVVAKTPEPDLSPKETVEPPKPKEERLGGLEALVATGLSRFTDKRKKAEKTIDTPDTEIAPDKLAAELTAQIQPVESPAQDIVFEPAEEDVLVLTELVKPTGGREAKASPQPAAKPAPAGNRPSPAAQALLSPFSGEDTAAKDALENLMKQALQPMLSKWMEDNLEDIVERIVREELHKPVPKK